MAIVIMQNERVSLLDLWRVRFNGYWYGLFVNPVTVTKATVWGDLVECSDGGYTTTGRHAPAFVGAALDGSGCAYLAGNDLEWAFSFSGGTFTIYGYFAIDTASGAGTVKYAENAGTPVVVPSAGFFYRIPAEFLLGTFGGCTP